MVLDVLEFFEKFPIKRVVTRVEASDAVVIGMRPLEFKLRVLQRLRHRDRLSELIQIDGLTWCSNNFDVVANRKVPSKPLEEGGPFFLARMLILLTFGPKLLTH